MVILTNCLSEKADEGCLKVATGLTKRIKRSRPSTTVLSYDRHPVGTDQHMRLNKLFLNRPLYSLLREKNEPLLYIPFSSCTRASIIRILVLSLFGGVPVNALFVGSNRMDALFGRLLRLSRVKIFCISREAQAHFSPVSEKEVVYLKTGVDAERFTPVDQAEKTRLRGKYGIPEDAEVLLHVGHLKEGRNIRTLLDVDERFHVLLVVSTETRDSWDEKLRAELKARPSTTILDSYLDNIEEIYRLSDIYFFPVLDALHCIDTPLSALEAAACGIPVVTTPYGELKELVDKEGFYRIESFGKSALNGLLYKALREKKSGRDSVLEYHWSNAVERLLSIDGAD